MRMTTRWLGIGLLGVIVATAPFALAGDREGGDAQWRGWRQRIGKWVRGRRLRDRRLGERVRRAAVRREMGRRALKRLMEAPEERVRQALDAARRGREVRERVREKAAAAVVEAWTSARTAAPEERHEIRADLRDRIRAMLEEEKAPLTEAGRPLVQGMDPERRARIEEHLSRRGRSFDEDRVARWAAWRLARHPWAEALLKARLAHPPR